VRTTVLSMITCASWASSGRVTRRPVRVEPLAQQRFAAVRHRRTRGLDGQQRCGTASGGEASVDGGAQASAGVFQGAVQDWAASGLDGVECGVAGGDRGTEPEGQPGLAELGRSGEEVESFTEQARSVAPFG
jgi:hypothetical protein